MPIFVQCVASVREPWIHNFHIIVHLNQYRECFLHITNEFIINYSFLLFFSLHSCGKLYFDEYTVKELTYRRFQIHVMFYLFHTHMFHIKALVNLTIKWKKILHFRPLRSVKIQIFVLVSSHANFFLKTKVMLENQWNTYFKALSYSRR